MWPNLASMHTTTRHTFHHQMMAVYINWQFSQVLVLKVAQAVFAIPCFWSLSDIHKCSGHLQMAPSSLDKQIARCDLSHDWLMSLAMDFAALCDMWRWKWHLLIATIWLFSVQTQPLPATLWLPACPHLPLYKGDSGIGYTSKKLSKMAGNSASHPLNNWLIDRLWHYK